MKVQLLDYTGSGHDDPFYAAKMMVFTKRTRVEMSADTFDETMAMTEFDVIAELEYMANTIPSSWEFCTYTFLLTGVTRSFTHQLVRTRTASYAQQTMQILDMSKGWECREGPTIVEDEERLKAFRKCKDYTADTYKALVKDGAKIEDVRELLPTGIETNIVVKADLRTLIGIFHSRISPRNLGQFRDVAVGMRANLLRVHPWASIFIARTADLAFEELDAMIQEHVPAGPRQATMMKLVDQLRRKS
jgi:thymidylate synthase ThyX